MKVLSINGEFYLYPSNCATPDEFSAFLSSDDSKFIKIRKLFENNCVSPYYILEEIKEVWLSVASIDEFYEEEVVIFDREEYEKMLQNVKKKLCARCEDKDECFNDKKEEYREKLCLDGTCFEFCEED